MGSSAPDADLAIRIFDQAAASARLEQEGSVPTSSVKLGWRWRAAPKVRAVIRAAPKCPWAGAVHSPPSLLSALPGSAMGIPRSVLIVTVLLKNSISAARRICQPRRFSARNRQPQAFQVAAVSSRQLAFQRRARIGLSRSRPGSVCADLRPSPSMSITRRTRSGVRQPQEPASSAASCQLARQRTGAAITDPVLHACWLPALASAADAAAGRRAAHLGRDVAAAAFLDHRAVDGTNARSDR